MSVKIRLARHGAKKAPFYRVVVADGRARRDGRFIEILGRYNPRVEPAFVELDVEKAEAWMAKGAQPSEAVAKLIAIAKGDKTAPVVEAKLSKKAAEKIKADAEAAEKAKAEAAAAAEKAKADAKAAKEAAAAAAAEAETQVAEGEAADEAADAAAE